MLTIESALAALTRGIQGPCIIGATGGSGTRVVARIARGGGMYIGTNLNISTDALDFGRYSNRWINSFMSGSRSPETEAEMVEDLMLVLQDHLRSLDPSARVWGWKEPRSAFLLPYFHTHFRELKFLHVVRDGRDMAFSANQNQLTKHGSTMLKESEAHWNAPLQSIALWSRLNLRVADYAERHLAGQYLRIRFEDLCGEPVETIRRIFEFFGLEGDPAHLAHTEVSAPASLGRWRNMDAGTLEAFHRVAAPALVKFGYEVTDTRAAVDHVAIG